MPHFRLLGILRDDVEFLRHHNATSLTSRRIFASTRCGVTETPPIEKSCVRHCVDVIITTSDYYLKNSIVMHKSLGSFELLKLDQTKWTESVSPTACHRCHVSSEFKGVLPRRFGSEMGPAICAGYTLRRNTMRIARFNFEKWQFLLFFVLRFFLSDNLLKTLHLPP